MEPHTLPSRLRGPALVPKANTRLDRPSRLKRKVLFKKKTGNKKKNKKNKKKTGSRGEAGWDSRRRHTGPAGSAGTPTWPESTRGRPGDRAIAQKTSPRAALLFPRDNQNLPPSCCLLHNCFRRPFRETRTCTHTEEAFQIPGLRVEVKVGRPPFLEGGH